MPSNLTRLTDLFPTSTLQATLHKNSEYVFLTARVSEKLGVSKGQTIKTPLGGTLKREDSQSVGFRFNYGTPNPHITGQIYSSGELFDDMQSFAVKDAVELKKIVKIPITGKLGELETLDGQQDLFVQYTARANQIHFKRKALGAPWLDNPYYTARELIKTHNLQGICEIGKRLRSTQVNDWIVTEKRGYNDLEYVPIYQTIEDFHQSIADPIRSVVMGSNFFVHVYLRKFDVHTVI